MDLAGNLTLPPLHLVAAAYGSARLVHDEGVSQPSLSVFTQEARRFRPSTS